MQPDARSPHTCGQTRRLRAFQRRVASPSGPQHTLDCLSTSAVTRASSSPVRWPSKTLPTARELLVQLQAQVQRELLPSPMVARYGHSRA